LRDIHSSVPTNRSSRRLLVRAYRDHACAVAAFTAESSSLGAGFVLTAPCCL